MLSTISATHDHRHSMSLAPQGFYPVFKDPKPEPPFDSADYKNDGKAHLLLAASGSVATIKLHNICTALSTTPNLSIRIILTQASRNFLAGQSAEQPKWQTLLQIKNVDGLYLDQDEWIHPWVRNEKILHIELRRWADLLVIAPLSMDTMAKIAHGFAENLLTSVVLAWDVDGSIDGKRKRIIVAPAGNTAMYKNPITVKNFKILEDELGVRKTVQGQVIGSESGHFEVLHSTKEKSLACGDVGGGAMREWTEIVEIIEERLSLKKSGP